MENINHKLNKLNLGEWKIDNEKENSNLKIEKYYEKLKQLKHERINLNKEIIEEEVEEKRKKEIKNFWNNPKQYMKEKNQIT